MKNAGLIGVIAVCALVACSKQTSELTFMLVEEGRNPYSPSYGDKYDGTVGRKYMYEEIILIDGITKSMVKKHRNELKRLMIYHYVRLTPPPIDKISTDIDEVHCSFLKSTPKIKKYFKGHRYEFDKICNGCYVGGIYMTYCKKDHTKRYVNMNIITDTIRYMADCTYQPTIEYNKLQNDCDPAWYESNKDNDLVKYYMELRNK